MNTMDNKELDKQFSHFAEDNVSVFDVEKAKFEYTKDRVSMQLENERWKNRRRMAWLAMWAMVIATFSMFTVVPESKIEKLDEIVSWFMMAMASIVGTYIGTATWAQVSQARINKPQDQSNPYDSYGAGRLDVPGANKDDYYREK